MVSLRTAVMISVNKTHTVDSWKDSHITVS